MLSKWFIFCPYHYNANGKCLQGSSSPNSEIRVHFVGSAPNSQIRVISASTQITKNDIVLYKELNAKDD